MKLQHTLRPYRVPFVLFLCVLLAFFLLRAGVLTGELMSISHAQYVVSLPLLLLSWFLVRRLAVASPLLVLFGLVGTAVGGAYAFSLAGVEDYTFLAARFGGDVEERRSRIFREALNEELDVISADHIGRYYRAIQGEADLKHARTQQAHLLGIVSGDDDRLRVDFFEDAREEKTKYQFQSPWNGTVLELSQIGFVPAVEFSHLPVEPGVSFLGHLVAGLSLPVGSERELALRAAAGMRSLWPSLSHVAYPAWQLGNDYLAEAFSVSPPEVGLARCAEVLYRDAASFLRDGDNPPLRIAVFNNSGVLLSGLALSRKERSELKEAKRDLERAKMLAKSTAAGEKWGRHYVAVPSNNLRKVQDLLEQTNTRKQNE